MKEVISSGFTPQRKLIGVNNRYGNSGIKKQQGTTVIKYDTLPIDGSTTYRFFEGANNRDFPLTNVGSEGNRLPVGSSMICERAYISVVDKEGDDYTSVVGIQATVNAFMGEFTLQVANKECIKNVPLMSWIPLFNKNSGSVDYNNFEFDTQVVLQPLLEYIAVVRFPALAASLNGYLRLTLEGTGSIISPSSPF
jgi:hypothetical protein|tara:strand:- start:774 stop:1358 length:585 start_codon:yes stop_codon:yes gene_type:complete